MQTRVDDIINAFEIFGINKIIEELNLDNTIKPLDKLRIYLNELGKDLDAKEALEPHTFLKERYNSLSRQYHPDKQGQDTTKMTALNNAWELLRNELNKIKNAIRTIGFTDVNTVEDLQKIAYEQNTSISKLVHNQYQNTYYQLSQSFAAYNEMANLIHAYTLINTEISSLEQLSKVSSIPRTGSKSPVLDYFICIDNINFPDSAVRDFKMTNRSFTIPSDKCEVTFVLNNPDFTNKINYSLRSAHKKISKNHNPPPVWKPRRMQDHVSIIFPIKYRNLNKEELYNIIVTDCKNRHLVKNHSTFETQPHYEQFQFNAQQNQRSKRPIIQIIKHLATKPTMKPRCKINLQHCLIYMTRQKRLISIK